MLALLINFLLENSKEYDNGRITSARFASK